MTMWQYLLHFGILCMVGLLPSCGGNNVKRPQLKTTIKTNIDIPETFSDEKLARIGLTNEIPDKQPDFVSVVSDVPATSLPGQEQHIPGSPAHREPMPETDAVPATPQEEEPSIEFHFENADLELLLNQISELYDFTFVADDSITPMLQGAKSLKGNKISFKTQHPLTRSQAWDLFLTFLDIAGFTIISEANPKIKRIVTVEAARQAPLPAFIGVPSSSLPNSDEMIRYVYFIENGSLDTIKDIVDKLRSSSSSLVILQEMKGFVLTDKSYNIKSLMNIVKELDKLSMPQAMSVLKLRKADALEVKKLYDSLAQTDEKSLTQQRFFPNKKSPASHYFSDAVSVFAEPRTNSLILLGPGDAIKRIEDFIIQSVDTDLPQPYSPLHVMQLRYADAKTIADIMNEVTRFGATTEAGKTGGVRAGDKYMKPITFTPEPETNQLVIKGDYEDFLKAKDVVMELDAPQPQVAIEVLLLSVSLNEQKQLGAQLRSRVPGNEGLMGTNATWQTSGLFGTQGIVENPNGTGVDRLLGNLLDLVRTGVTAGNTIISLGDSLGVRGIIQALQTTSNVQVLSNPFLIATNKTEALVSLGEVRRVQTSTIVGGAATSTPTYGDAPAKLEVKIKPQINSDGMIVLQIVVSLSQFVGAANPENAVRTTREIKTKTIVTNKEVLALGGLIQNNIDDMSTKIPILGDIPILGWFFKNKRKIDSKANLLILISSRIIEPGDKQSVANFTNNHLTDYTDTINNMKQPSERRDPINRWFFGPYNANEAATDEFIFRQQKEAFEELKIDRDVVVPPLLAQNERTKEQPLPAPAKKEPATVVATASRRSRNTIASSASKESKEVQV